MNISDRRIERRKRSTRNIYMTTSLPEGARLPAIEVHKLTGNLSKYGPPTISGLASSFSSVVESLMGPSRVASGAFTKTINDWKQGGRKKAIPLLWSHGSDSVPVGLVTDLYESQRGLEFKAVLDELDSRSDLLESKIKQGMLSAVSIGFSVLKSEPLKIDNRSGRLLREIRLFEISIVNWPADDDARIESLNGDMLQRSATLPPPLPLKPQFEAPATIEERIAQRKTKMDYYARVVKAIG